MAVHSTTNETSDGPTTDSSHGPTAEPSLNRSTTETDGRTDAKTVAENADAERSPFAALEDEMSAFTRECDRLEAQFDEYERQLTEIRSRLEAV